MLKNRPSIYFVYATVIVTIFLWLIFDLWIISSRSMNLSTASQLILGIVPAIIGAVAVIIAFSTATPLINDFLITLRRLLRLDNLSNPLLLRLSLEAPGTYHHSINVSNLAQKAAKAIGADSLMVRVAAYYHDIGKLDYPEFFIENHTDSDTQMPEESPKKSAKTIIDHVAKGVKLAKTNNLTDDICDLILEHHGTTLVSFFFNAAKDKDGATLRDDFRYPGPKPSSKESGILMICDCCEAAIRSLKEIHSADIEETVTKIILEKIDEGQLENTGLSERELQKVKASIIETLNVVYHRRIVK